MFVTFGILERLRSECESISRSLCDLGPIFYGGETATHIAIVADPLKLLFEAAGDILRLFQMESMKRSCVLTVYQFVRRIYSSGRVRFTDFNFRTSDFIGFGSFKSWRCLSRRQTIGQ